MTQLIDAARAVEAAQHSCDRELRAVPNGWATSGHRQEGELWECSCGRSWMHICDEAEGCYWVADDTWGGCEVVHA